MVIGDQLKEPREKKDMSQGDIEHKTGLLRWHISRVENGHTVLSVPTLERMARALEVPMYQLIYDGEKPPALRVLKSEPDSWGESGREAKTLDLLMAMALKMARSQKNATKKQAGK